MNAFLEMGRPEVCALPDGRIAIFVGVGYRFLPLDVAEQFRDEINAAIRAVKSGDGQGLPHGTAA